MKILYDHQIWRMQKFGGISRYFAELIKNSNGMYEPVVTGVYSQNVYLKDLRLSKKFPIPFKFKGKGRILKYLNEGETERLLKAAEINLIHPTYYEPYYIGKKKIVLTVHDMIHELFPEQLRDGKTIQNKKAMIYAATKIIAISQTTKNDLLKFYSDINPEKIEVVYHGNSFPINKIEQKEDYILFTGQRDNYKNFANFVRAVAPILKEYNQKLICTGREFAAWEHCLFEQLGISDFVECKFASDKELSELYTKARLFVFPSVYEGFGIPILEAFSSGCPLLLSNTSCFPEIAGDAGYYFDPYSIDDMREKIKDVLLSDSKQSELVKKGTKRLKFFSWEKCAKETALVYKTAINTNGGGYKHPVILPSHIISKTLRSTPARRAA